ncbi:MAG: hypothetical protein C4325_03060 [Blastocatellia bacterium]
MPEATSVSQIISQYRRFGWRMQAALVDNRDLENLLSEIGPLDENVEVRIFEIPCLWFSRRTQPDSDTWEIRRLRGNPYALVEVISDAATQEMRRAILQRAERRMLDAADSLGKR